MQLSSGLLQLLLLLHCVLCFDDESEDSFGSVRDGPVGTLNISHSNQPYFLHNTNMLNLSVQAGATAHLHCRVAGLRDQAVSWYRKKGGEIQLITFGFVSYHNDDRFSLNYEHPGDWRLQIQYVQDRDEGTYECQVSSHPPLTRVIHLTVVVPQIHILDDRGEVIQEKFYQRGSTIELQCKVKDVPTATSLNLSWHRGQQTLNYDATRGGVSVKTELRGTVARSWLRVSDVRPKDSGTYFCNVTSLTAAGVQIHVVPDEHPAAIQRGGHSLCPPCLSLIIASFTITICSNLHIHQTLSQLPHRLFNIICNLHIHQTLSQLPHRLFTIRTLLIIISFFTLSSKCLYESIFR